MIVPFARGQAQQPQQAQPSETDMLMALAAMHEMGRVKTAQMDDAQRAFRDVQFGTKDAPNQADIDKLDLSHAVQEEGEQKGKLVPWRNKLIDPRKLSPKELKATGIDY